LPGPPEMPASTPNRARTPDPEVLSSRRFETYDLALAAYLRCRQYALLDVHREHGGRCVFVFADRPTRPHEVASFFDETGTVPALKFAEATRLLKARIYQR
jgi:Domain of unknown function (DUF5659)